MIARLWLLCLALFLAEPVSGQGFQFMPDQFSQRSNSSWLVNNTTKSATVYEDTLVFTSHDKWTEMVANGGIPSGAYSFKSRQGLVRLGINHDTPLVVPAFKYAVTLNILCFTAGPGQSLSSPVPATNIVTTLNLSYNPDSLQPYTDLAVYKFSGYDAVQVIITDIRDISSPPGGSGYPVVNRFSSLARNFFIETEVSTQRYDNVAFNLSSKANAYTPGLLDIDWIPVSASSSNACDTNLLMNGISIKPVAYELEWTYVDDYNAANNPPYQTGNSVSYDFRKNSTRIRTGNPHYQLPLIYEHGTILYRVRSIRPDPSNYKDLIYSGWSKADYGTEDRSSSCFATCGYTINSAHSRDSLNWQYTISFAEDGKYKHVINYFDGSLKGRQTQTKINTDNDYIIAADKIYDYEGRPAIQTLPTPVLQQSLNYRPDITLNNYTHLPYRAADFDHGCSIPDSIPRLYDSARANIYYSPLNPVKTGMQAFVPDAKGYPFIQTIYSPDNTNKVLWQGGAGKDHQLWKGHGTRYEYVRATQPEIDRLLGSEAGYNRFYPRQIVTDPNGQSSFSIFDPAGKVVATGLQGDSPDSTTMPIVPLDNFEAGQQKCTDLLLDADQVKTLATLSASTSVYADNAGQHTLKYSVYVPPFAPGCSGKYLTAKAFFTADVTTDCGIPIANLRIADSAGSNTITSSSAGLYAASSLRSETLAKGKYLVQKKLSFPEAAIRHQVDSFVAINEPNCYHNEPYFIRRAVDSTKFPCVNPAEPDPCENLRLRMMRELYPGAKYGQYLRNFVGKFAAGMGNSIFTPIAGGMPGNNTRYGVIAYATTVDDNYNLLSTTNYNGNYTTWDMTPDPHWQVAHRSGPFHDAVMYNHMWDPTRPWISDYPYAGTPDDTLYFKTNIYIGPGAEDSLYFYVYGDGNDDPIDRTDMDVFIDETTHILMPNRAWGRFPHFDVGWHEIKIRWYNWNGESAFHAEFESHAGIGQYRYQADCLTLPDTVIFGGVAYTDIAHLPTETFIRIFNDSIAAALLPLHPEYCRLQGCGDLDFVQQLERLETPAQAKAAKFFTLDDLINNDPLYKADPTIQRHDLLAAFPGFSGKQIDQLALELAYCNAGNTDELAQCTANVYNNEIASFAFINNDVEQSYFNMLKSLYLGNRGFNKLRWDTDTSSSCGPCSTYRMKLTGTPLYTNLYTSAGDLSSELSKVPQWVADQFNAATAGTTTTSVPAELEDSLSNTKEQVFQAYVQTIRDALTNCTHSATVLDQIANNIIDACPGNHTVEAITPQVVKDAITNSNTGLSLSDLCHPFLVSYNLYDAHPELTTGFSCEDEALYAGLTDFMNRPEVVCANRGASASGYSCSSGVTLSTSNPFEDRLIQAVLSSSVTVTGYEETIAATGATFVKLVVAPISGPPAILYIKNLNGADPLINTGSDAHAVGAACLTSAPSAAAIGYIAKGSAIADFDIGSGQYRYLVWSRDLSLMRSALPALSAGCVTCLDVKRALEDFASDQPAYGYDGAANHPLFEATLTNYLNHKLHRQHSYSEYQELMTGCAVTDQVALPQYTATYRIGFGTEPEADSFLQRSANIGSGHAIRYIRYHTGTGGSPELLLDFNSLPKDTLLAYKEYADNYTAATHQYLYQAASGNLIFAPAGCTPSSAYYSQTSAAVQVWENGAYKDYTLYGLSLSGSALDQAGAQTDLKASMSGCTGTYNLFDHLVLRPADYSSQLRQDYLSTIYGVSGTHNDALAAIATDALYSLTGFSGKTLTYQDPYCKSTRKDLYIYDSLQTSHPGYYLLLNTVLNQVSATFGTLFPSLLFAPNVSNGLSVIRKANGDYWYRYFDANNKLRNVFITPPSGLPIDLKDLTFSGNMVQGQGDDSIYTFYATVYDGSSNPYRVTGHTDFSIGYCRRLSNVILDGRPGPEACFDSLDCERDLMRIAINNGKASYRFYNDSLREAISHSMLAWLTNNAKDTLVFCGQESKYQYTLYYYDLAGNLTRTVPPQGVQVIADASLPAVAAARKNDANTATATHKKPSLYEYNAQNQVIYQKSPDGGVTYFFYDAAGRPTFSQNSQQRLEGYYTYTLYDQQGRVTETGEVKLGCVQTNATGADFDDTPCNFPVPGGGTALSVHPYYIVQPYVTYTAGMDVIRDIVRGKPRRDVVITTYDTARTDLAALPGQHLAAQQNLRKRVSAIAYFPQKNPDTSAANTAEFTTHYSYDLGGNVSTIVYDYLPLASLGQRYKRVDYDYDLISGKVNLVSYNRGHPDQFYQQYAYDADNRITRVQTSNDGLIWNTDARYKYYTHGPLAQVRIGDAQLQSLEYAYTIQGWLKAINGDALRPDKEMGGNGQPGDLTYARDVVAHALDYYRQDYQPIDPAATVTNLAAPAKDLWNGNIARQTTAVAGLGNMQRSYGYDQLQRLKITGNALVDEATLTATPSDLYKSAYSYDGDGNLTALERRDGAGSQLDNFTYHYTAGGNDNRLQSVEDAAGATSGTDLQPGQSAGNYKYDERGNLVKDAQGHLKLGWNLYGKLTSVTDTVSRQVITYSYDGAGNRIMKEVAGARTAYHQDRSGEYYVRDATGNTLAVYERRSGYDPVRAIRELNSVLESAGPGTLATFLSSGIAPMDGFAGGLQTLATTGFSPWVSGVTSAYGPGFYVSHDREALGRILYSSSDWVGPMRSYELSNGTGLLSAALGSSSGGLKVPFFSEILLHDTEGRALIRDFYSYMSNADPTRLSDIYSLAGLSQTGDVEVDAQALLGYLGGDPDRATELASQIVGNASGAFYRTLVADDSLFGTPLVAAIPGTGYAGPGVSGTALQIMAAGALDLDTAAVFIESWNPPADSLLRSAASLDYLFNIVYAQRRDSVIGGFVGEVGAASEGLAGLLAGLAEVDAVSYGQRVVQFNPDLGPQVRDVLSLALSGDTLRLAEHHIYGSARLGVQRYEEGLEGLRRRWSVSASDVQGGLSDTSVWYSGWYGDVIASGSVEAWGHGDGSRYGVSRTVGRRYYELSDHLGNVVATVVDRKSGHVSAGNGSLYDMWHANVSGAQDYYPFGMLMSGRSVSAGGDYRFGYNGKMKDNEIAGVGNSYDYGFRMYDSRLGRFMSSDPLTAKFPMLTPYQFASNMPIWAKDQDGKEALIVNNAENKITFVANVYYITTGPGAVSNVPALQKELASQVLARVYAANRDAKEEQKSGYTIDIKVNNITQDANGKPLTRESAKVMQANSSVSYTGLDGKAATLSGWQTGVVVEDATEALQERGNLAEFVPGAINNKVNQILVQSKVGDVQQVWDAAREYVHEFGHFLGVVGHPTGIENTDPGITSREHKNVELQGTDIGPMINGGSRQGKAVKGSYSDN